MNISRRAVAVCGLASVALISGAVVPAAAQTADAPLIESAGAFSASGSADLITVDASLAGTPVVDVNIIPASGTVDSGASQAVTALTQNLHANLLGEVSLDGILSEATQTAPPGNDAPVSAQLLAVPAAPVLDLTVSDATAFADWPDATECLVADQTLSDAFVQTAGADVLSDPSLGTVVSANYGLGGALSSRTTITPRAVDGQEGLGLEVTAATQIDGVTLFGGTPAEVTVEIGSAPTLTVQANGTPNDAAVTFVAPVVNVNSPDGSDIPDIPLINLAPMDELGGLIDQITDGLEDAIDQTVAGAGIADLDILLGEETLVTEVAADGTSVSASAAAAIIHVTVLSAIGDKGVDATVTIAPMTASASVPAGGIACAVSLPREDPDPVTEPPLAALPTTGGEVPLVAVFGIAGAALALQVSRRRLG